MKRLILCCDGTWNTADQQQNGIPCPSNVIKFAYRVAKRDADVPQVVFYDQGVGTGNFLDRFTGGAFGDGLTENIFDAYRFLIANFEPGDRLFVFGFSRGAYTARSLCGMIRKCGVLKRESVLHYREALDLYRNQDVHPSDPPAQAFRTEHSLVGDATIEIDCLGVWDTVGALGIPIRGLRWLTRHDQQFHDTELSGAVKNAFQALAIDEHRAPFAPTLWSYVPKEGQRVEQVWFSGAHSDVGGGYTEGAVSDIPLGWMIDRARETGLAFDAAVAAAHPLKPDPLGKLHNSKTGLYFLTAGIDREIGVNTSASREEGRTSGGTDLTQAIHESVRVRWDRDSDYRPANLRDYWRRVGDPRAKA
jgi:uncharacterized protein (DUF2235 family)